MHSSIDPAIQPRSHRRPPLRHGQPIFKNKMLPPSQSPKQHFNWGHLATTNSLPCNNSVPFPPLSEADRACAVAGRPLGSHDDSLLRIVEDTEILEPNIAAPQRSIQHGQRLQPLGGYRVRLALRCRPSPATRHQLVRLRLGNRKQPAHAAHEAAPSTEMTSALPRADRVQFTSWSRLSK
jgi:hypothetical protein